MPKYGHVCVICLFQFNLISTFFNETGPLFEDTVKLYYLANLMAESYKLHAKTLI